MILSFSITFYERCHMDDDVKEITVSDLSKKINDNDDFILIDVRTDDEYNFSNIKQAKHIPLDQLLKFAELNKNKEYVLQCRSVVEVIKLHKL